MTDTKALESGPLLTLLLGRGGCDRPRPSAAPRRRTHGPHVVGSHHDSHEEPQPAATSRIIQVKQNQKSGGPQ